MFVVLVLCFFKYLYIGRRVGCGEISPVWLDHYPKVDVVEWQDVDLYQQEVEQTARVGHEGFKAWPF